MQIVIDIPDSDYERIKELVAKDTNYTTATTVGTAYQVIANGTVLPEGHGDLIDRDAAFAEFDKACCSYEGGLLKYIPTVIPADK